jgi:hypothetical protein
MLTIKQYVRIGEYLRKYDALMTQRDNSVSPEKGHELQDKMHYLYGEYKDVQPLFWSFDMARNIWKEYKRKLLLL